VKVHIDSPSSVIASSSFLPLEILTVPENEFSISSKVQRIFVSVPMLRIVVEPVVTTSFKSSKKVKRSRLK
jgi:hypothetical protein